MMAHVLRRMLLVVVAAAVFVGLIAAIGSAAAKPSNPTVTFISPSPSEGAALAAGSVSFKFSYNRTPKQTRTLVCALSGPTAASGPCDASVADGSKGAKSGKSYTGLANGSYAFVATVTLTDGGTASVTRHFTVNTPTRHIYWSSYGEPTGSIGRANVDGTAPNPTFISDVDFPNGLLAVDTAHIYWGNAQGNAVARANLDGSGLNQQFIPADSPSGIAVDDSYVYWANSTDTIGRAHLDGTDVDQNFISAPGVHGLAVNDGHIFWTYGYFGANGVGRANVDGSNPDESFITLAPNTAPTGLALSATNIYWGTYNTASVGRAKLDGSEVNQSFVQSNQNVDGVAVDAAHIYWVNRAQASIGRANLDGTGTNQNFISGISFPRGVAVDGE